jgi:hypothetical protein
MNARLLAASDDVTVRQARGDECSSHEEQDSLRAPPAGSGADAELSRESSSDGADRW